MSENKTRLVAMHPSEIINSSNREHLLINHELALAECAEKLKKKPESHHQFKNENEQPDTFDPNLRKRVTIMDLINAEIAVCYGKFFLCRVLVPWVFGAGTDSYQSYTVVEDPEGRLGFQLNVISRTHESRSEFMATMSPGNNY